uniref:Uncharacterized protein n=1 Tax=Anguilla anguilla TaxID=7936 RepID=A0A0E9T299_ANGAN
MMQQLLSPTMP